MGSNDLTKPIRPGIQCRATVVVHRDDGGYERNEVKRIDSVTFKETSMADPVFVETAPQGTASIEELLLATPAVSPGDSTHPLESI